MATNTTKMNLKRTYCYLGKDYGPGEVEVPNEIKSGNDVLKPAEDIKAREDEYEAHLKAGGEPVAPVTPSIADNTGQVQNLKTLNTPAATNTTTAPSPNPSLKAASTANSAK